MACKPKFFRDKGTIDTVCQADGAWSIEPAKAACSACPAACGTCTSATTCQSCVSNQYRLTVKGACFKDDFLKTGYLVANANNQKSMTFNVKGQLVVADSRQTKWGLTRSGRIVLLDDPSVGWVADIAVKEQANCH